MRKLVNVSLIGLALTAQPVAAEDASTLAPLAYFGLKAAEGKTSVADGAGGMEVAALMIPLAKSMSTKISEQINNPAKNYFAQGDPTKARVILAMNDETVDYRTYSIVSQRLTIITQAVSLIELGCHSPKPGRGKSPGRSIGNESGAGMATGTQPVFSSIVGALMTDREIRSVEQPGVEKVLRNALISQTIGDTRAPAAWMTLSDKPPVGDAGILNRYLDSATVLAEAQTKCGENKPALARLAIQDKELSGLTASGDGGAPSALDKAILAESMGLTNTLLLRVEVEKTPGTMINSSNIWTTLGAEGLKFASGLVATYRLIEPSTAKIIATGNVFCLSRARGFRTIHAKGAPTRLANHDPADCAAL